MKIERSIWRVARLSPTREPERGRAFRTPAPPALGGLKFNTFRPTIRPRVYHETVILMICYYIAVTYLQIPIKTLIKKARIQKKKITKKLKQQHNFTHLNNDEAFPK